MQKFSFNCPDELAEAMKKRAEKLDGGVSELIRVAVEQYCHGNMQVVLSKFEEGTYENAKTRALVRIGLEKAGLAITDEDVDEAEAMATAYLKERKGE